MKITKVQKSTFDLSVNTKKKAEKTFLVTLNWYGENVKTYTHAARDKIALSNAMKRLSGKLGITFFAVKIYILNSNKDRWKVKEVLR